MLKSSTNAPRRRFIQLLELANSMTSIRRRGVVARRGKRRVIPANKIQEMLPWRFKAAQQAAARTASAI
jgi:hypothetical protein